MGFNEDDRIRFKNRVNNTAYQLYENLRREGLSNSAIEQYATDMSTVKSDLNRDEIYLTVLKIVRRSHDSDIST